MEAVSEKISKELFGFVNGIEVHLFTFRNQSGNQLRITNYGGIISSWKVTDKNGIERDIVIGFDDLETYLKPHPYIGVIAGRYANRIANGRFHIGNDVFQVTQNEFPHHLHGGNNGFDKVIWNAFVEDDNLILTYKSPDGEDGFPGNVETHVRYSFDDDNSLSIQYLTTSDKPTVFNITSHSYFNLSGNIQEGILDHSLTIYADYYTPVSNDGIPTGEVLPVKDSIFDFTSSRKIRHANSFENYDHNYVLDLNQDKLRLAAVLSEEESGIQLEVFTTEPGMQLYTGFHLDGSFLDRGGEMIEKYAGVCLETQHFPDSPNHSHFPSTILNPGETYSSTTIYKLNFKS